MYEASCHCGNVRIEFSTLPATVTECNCSICRRYGALWAYFRREQVSVKADATRQSAYCWGDRSIEFWHCSDCGCLTHYESVGKDAGRRFALNARMLPLEQARSIAVRHFDGAASWKYLD
jgi:hypothetical protein